MITDFTTRDNSCPRTDIPAKSDRIPRAVSHMIRGGSPGLGQRGDAYREIPASRLARSHRWWQYRCLDAAARNPEGRFPYLLLFHARVSRSTQRPKRECGAGNARGRIGREIVGSVGSG